MVKDWTIEGGLDQCGHLVDASKFFTLSLSRTLTHLTADIAFFSPLPPCESDYEKWKSVFNAIQGLEEVKYFVCVREKTTVFGRFSSLGPLAKALTAILKMKSPYRMEKLDLKWLDEILGMGITSGHPELMSSSSVATSNSGFRLKVVSWCYQLWKRMCCLK